MDLLVRLRGARGFEWDRGNSGKNLRKPLVGTPPNLEDLEDGEPKVAIDFRRIYATLLQDVLRVEPKMIVPGWDPLPLFRQG